MVADPDTGKFVIDLDTLPTNFPTHKHAPGFWEALGRTIATFGFLEEVLGKAIFSLTATRRMPPGEIEAEFEEWLALLERALIDPLSGQIESYGKAVRHNTDMTVADLDDLVARLRKASIIRNVLCHGSWRVPDERGRSLPLFVNRTKEVFQTPIDVGYLGQVQMEVTQLACTVVSSVTRMGWQFPGSSGSGFPIWPHQCGER